MPEQLVVGVAIIKTGRVLAAQRAYPDTLAGLWELPGGKVAAGESATEAGVREVREELGCTVEVGAPLGRPVPIRPGLALQVHPASLTGGVPVPTEHAALRWLGPEELDDVDWLAADRPFLPALGEMLLDGERLPGGNVGGAVRIGETVRRSVGPWTPAIHDLLAYLAGAGLDGVPRVLGTDARGREILTYLPGRVIDVDTERLTDAELASAAGWLRRFHDTVRGFHTGGPRQWRFLTADVEPGQLVCHNDVAPYNFVVDGGELVGVFDWDLASPGEPLDDVGFLAWNCVPLFRDVDPTDAADRLRLLATSYGGCCAGEILRRSVVRMRIATERIAAGQAAGDEGMLNLAKVGEPAATRARIARLEAILPAITVLL